MTRGGSGSRTPTAAEATWPSSTSGGRRRDLIHAGPPLVGGRSGRPSPARPADRRAGGRRPCRCDRRRPDPAWAEVWSKVLFLGGRRAIANEARSRGLAAWWVADDGSLEMTPAAPGDDGLGRGGGGRLVRLERSAPRARRGRHPSRAPASSDRQRRALRAPPGIGREPTRPGRGPAASAPLSVSPAPTVSTASTVGAWIARARRPVDEHRPASAEADQRRPRARARGPSRRFGRHARAAVGAGEDRELALVRRQDVGELEGRAAEARWPGPG